VCFYNLCRVRETLRCATAMAAGVTDRLWSVEKLIEAISKEQTPLRERHG
jgi:hypothetical protein